MLPSSGNGSPQQVTSRGGRGSPHTTQTVVQRGLPDWRFMGVIEVQTSYLVEAGSLIIPISSPLFSCHQEKSCWEWAEAADFYILVYVWVRVPPEGCSPTHEVQLAGFQACSPLLLYLSLVLIPALPYPSS